MIRPAQSTVILSINGYFPYHARTLAGFRWGLFPTVPSTKAASLNDSRERSATCGPRIHIDHVFRRRAKAKKGKRIQKPQKCRWQWWHHVCQQDDIYSGYSYWDRCSNWVDEAMDARQPGWTGYPPGTKIAAAQWLRCCQMGQMVLTRNSYEEALPILYSTNTFVIGSFLDTPFHMSRLLLPEYTGLIISMDIAFLMNLLYTVPADLHRGWATVFSAFFAILDRSFPHLRRLRLTLGLKPSVLSKPLATDAFLDVFLEPWERFASGRTWTQLDSCVPDVWYERLRRKTEAQSVTDPSPPSFRGRLSLQRRPCQLNEQFSSPNSAPPIQNQHFKAIITPPLLNTISLN